MLLAAVPHVLGDAGIERAIGAANDVDEPRVARWLFHFGFLTVLDS